MQLKKNQIIMVATTFMGGDDIFMVSKQKSKDKYILKQDISYTIEECKEYIPQARVDFRSDTVIVYCHPDVKFKEEWNAIPNEQKTQELY